MLDPDSKLPVEIEIRKLESGGMVGIDGSWLAADEGPTYSPYDEGVELVIPGDEDEYLVIRSTDEVDDETGEPLYWSNENGWIGLKFKLNAPAERLEYLRGELRAERLSYDELAELQSFAEHIAEDDVELREAAGLPEFPEDEGN